MVPSADALHEFLGVSEESVASKDGVDEFSAGILAHLLAAFALGGFQHEVFAVLEEVLELVPQAIGAGKKVANQLT